MNTPKSYPAWIVVSILMIASTTYLLYFENKFWNNMLVSNMCAILLITLLFQLRKDKHREMYLRTRHDSFRKRSGQYPFLISLVALVSMLFVSQLSYTTKTDLVFSSVYISLVVLSFEIITEVTERRTINIGKTIIKGLKKSPAIDKLNWSLISEGSRHTLIFTCPNFSLVHVVRILQKIFHKCKYEVVVKDITFRKNGCCHETKVVEIILYKENHRSVLYLEHGSDTSEYTIHFSA